MKFVSRAVAGLLMFACAPAWAEKNIPDAEWMPGEIVVKLSASAMSSDAYKPSLASAGRTGIAAVDREMERLATTQIRGLFDLAAHADRKRALGMDRIFHIHYAGSEFPSEAAARLAALPAVEWAEPNVIARGSMTPNDPTYTLQWGLRNRGQAFRGPGDSLGTLDCDIDANQAWDVQTGSFSVVLAILDSGIDRTHPEFANRVQTGYDFVNNDNDPNDDLGHGTACAGIAAAAGNNGQGIAGVAWGVRILPVKVLNSMNRATNTSVVDGLTYAADFGADVISMSFGVAATSALLTAVNYAYGLDCLMVAATGNQNASSVEYPAAYDHVIAVGALSPCNERKSPTSCDGMNWGSNYGTELDLLAPGVLIHTTDIRGAGGYDAGDYATGFYGTSAATPFVAGIAALARSQVTWSNDQITSILMQSCDDLGAQNWDQETGWGRINTYAVMRTVSGGNFVGPNPFTETGSYRSPYRTLVGAVNVTQPGNWVVVRPGNYDEVTPVTLNKSLHIEAIDGGVTIH